MYYPKLQITIPDATCVVGGHVTMYFNPNIPNQSMGRVAKPWYTCPDQLSLCQEDFEVLDIDEACKTVSMPIEWADFTILPPLNTPPKPIV